MTTRKPRQCWQVRVKVGALREVLIYSFTSRRAAEKWVLGSRKWLESGDVKGKPETIHFVEVRGV